jgi:hypothetical protein
MDYGLTAILLIQGVVVVLLTFNLKTGRETNREVGKLNGGLGKLAVWASEHEKKDDERHENEREARRDLWGVVNDVKKKVGLG